MKIESGSLGGRSVSVVIAHVEEKNRVPNQGTWAYRVPNSDEAIPFRLRDRSSWVFRFVPEKLRSYASTCCDRCDRIACRCHDGWREGWRRGHDTAQRGFTSAIWWFQFWVCRSVERQWPICLSATILWSRYARIRASRRTHGRLAEPRGIRLARRKRTPARRSHRCRAESSFFPIARQGGSASFGCGKRQMDDARCRHGIRRQSLFAAAASDVFGGRQSRRLGQEGVADSGGSKSRQWRDLVDFGARAGLARLG